MLYVRVTDIQYIVRAGQGSGHGKGLFCYGQPQHIVVGLFFSGLSFVRERRGEYPRTPRGGYAWGSPVGSHPVPVLGEKSATRPPLRASAAITASAVSACTRRTAHTTRRIPTTDTTQAKHGLQANTAPHDFQVSWMRRFRYVKRVGRVAGRVRRLFIT